MKQDQLWPPIFPLAIIHITLWSLDEIKCGRKSWTHFVNHLNVLLQFGHQGQSWLTEIPLRRRQIAKVFQFQTGQKDSVVDVILQLSTGRIIIRTFFVNISLSFFNLARLPKWAHLTAIELPNRKCWSKIVRTLQVNRSNQTKNHKLVQFH